MNSNTFTEFIRILPPEGIEVYPKIKYVDVNDVPRDERQKTKEFFFSDPQYTVAINFSSFVKKGKAIGKQFCVYVYKDSLNNSIGNIKFMEVLDNPHGYGEGDFLYHKWVYPDYRYTKYSRYIIGDMIHILFMSNICKNLYVYVPLKTEDTDSDFWMDRVNLKMAPCISKQYPSDNSKIQKYILPKQMIEGFKINYLLLEFNGDIYRNMSLEEYLSASPDRDPDIIKKWLKEMNHAADLVRDLRRN